MAVSDTIKNIKTHIEEAYVVAEEKGATIPENKNLENLSDTISSISGGGDISEYFGNTISAGTSSKGGWFPMFKKIPSTPLTVEGTSLSYAFSRFLFETNPNIVSTSNVTDMSNMFANSSITNFNVSNFDTSNVTDMNGMFSYCQALQYVEGASIDISNFDTSKVTNISHMFAYSFMTTINLGQLDCSKVINCISMFPNCILLENIIGCFKDLGKGFLTTKAENYSNYTLSFQACNRLTHDSLMNIINGLYDIASAGVKRQKLLLGSTNMAKLSEEEIAIATNKGWNVTV